MKPKVALFDMDHTLMDNDCDVSWKAFLIEKGIADASENDEADRFYRQYLEGRLDVDAFLGFQLRQFKGQTKDEMAPLLAEHFERYGRPKLYRDAVAEVERYREANAPTAIVTSTNEAIAAPAAAFLGIDELLATRLEFLDGRYTGAIVPPYYLAEGKLAPAIDFCRRHGATLDEAAYYGDSASDLPLLRAVGAPVAVNPSGALEAEARAKNWRIVWWDVDGE